MDVEDSQPKTITILLKTPSQAVEDQTVEGVHLNWTVKDLKTHLSAVYPTKLAESDQRLIYGGKLLPDHLHIRELFAQTDPIPTLHLVFAAKMQPKAHLGARPKVKEPAQQHPSSPRPTPPPASASSTAELRQRRQASSTATPVNTHAPSPPPGVPAGPDANVPGTPQMTQPAFPGYSLYSPQQLMWLQHVYARQYYMQYQAAMAAAGTGPSIVPPTVVHHPPVPAHQVPVPAPIANQNPIDNLQPANPNPAQDGAFIDAGVANQNMRMNAQGGPVVEDEEDMERDWLDWLYSAARLGVLLMIVYFNSNLSRFLLVMGTLFLMYLHTAGWFPFRRREQIQGPNHLQPPEVQHNEENENRIPNPVAELAEGQRELSADAEGSDEREPVTALLVPPHRVSVMWTAWVFFKTFFSSLIPEVPQDMAN
ncbi:homocysteine-responsive endoplasmic reticulum-resident ubiquitin-like domain member 1 protein [Phyllopteryx taeniolatus]|uniref:homocysteine-responsive endoplasmic reticulum-resident ubiquitin-like domain member 1 protein n=1 Tax=Phyllopteryx taeniolatus TaxID=161469 RepID=UPI002AD3A712|nr:homocysteine-responsive endoplasmic reticulum-resident ubiquitin-like domain member 1 protein [Phyllopteryx taeniolatus]XP_061629754.1 homocysteine-responsive endoplasmic reticulum-resident ubiquitin-like domain member 1 protein [Phyllopteryx taeniolatus]XP_061629755.1 homocysteine-responsive endoplasmic reticulum-resident ubiquitin-like domain member 1 protein [Phyllopteryx taeniolatus]